MDDGLTSLTAGFQPVDEATWRALVEKTLNGATFEKRLVSRTYDGIDIQPLYTASNAAPPLAGFLRIRPPFDADRSWDIRAVVDHPDPSRANVLALEALEGGAASLLVKIDPSGADGVAIASRADLEQALDKVLLDLAPVALDAGYLGPDAARWLGDLAQSRTLRPHLHLHLDPIGVFARTGASEGALDGHVVAAAEAAARLDASSGFLASGAVIHEAGGADAQEIAFMAAAGLAYAKASAAAGMSIDRALDGVILGLAVDADYFTAIAKIRAAKAVWAKVRGAILERPGLVRIEARSSRRMLSTLDPWVNMLRLTSAAFAASIGGADAVVLDPFTQPLGRPTPFARRQARNVQLVLMEEAHLGRVIDPAGGAWFIETLTDKIARAAWSLFQEIERRGGVVAGLTDGFIADQVGQAADARRADVARRKSGLVGVSEFPDLTESAVETDAVEVSRHAKPSPPTGRPGPDDACPPLTPRRLSEGFEHLRQRAGTMGRPPTAFLATIGEPRDFTGRVGFCRNFLAAGGVSSATGDAAVQEARDADLVVICGSDAGYGEIGAETARFLKEGGAGLVYVTGKPGALEAPLRAAGVDDFIFVGLDVEAALAKILDNIDQRQKP